mmetsp:Transcript_13601/g.20836  ORF Transcript_13601/g.20836 Transcript_13601/m.20836 type:complete len:207 (-) Transcript_13601:291-911(-)
MGKIPHGKLYCAVAGSRAEEPNFVFLYSKFSSSLAFRLASSMTIRGTRAISATWIPKLSRHGPSSTLYRNVSSFEPSSRCAPTWQFRTHGSVSASAVSSWKCVANSVGQPRVSTMYFEMAHARPYPSKVLVPRPSSSTMMRLRGVAACRIEDDSSISAMKVEMPCCCRSPAPTRHRIRSTTLMRAEVAGTKDPTWAMATMDPRARM